LGDSGPPQAEVRRGLGASAASLALFRISVALVLLLSSSVWTAPRWAGLPRALFVAPEGLRWFAAHVPIDPTLAAALRGLLVLGALLGLVGLYTRAAFALVTVAGFYVLALPQLSGSVIHDMHLLWFAALLAASPSGDAWSVDAWRAGRRFAAPEGPRYAWPLDVACLLFAAIYFFPGFWKLATSGVDWFWSDNLRNQMYWKWFQNGWLPLVRIDRWPTLCRLAALGVVLFELGFVLLVLRRRLRPLAALFGVAFHLLSELFLRIPFFGLWGLYLVFFDARRVAHWAGWTLPSAGVDGRPPTRFARALGVGLLAVVTVQGARGAVQAWPFGCYPTFAWTVGTELPDVALEAVRPDGTTREILLGPRRPEIWALSWRVAGAYGQPPTRAALAGFWQIARRDPQVAASSAGATQMRFHRVMRSVIPEERERPARRVAALGALDL
jgi:hypothetical protein